MFKKIVIFASLLLIATGIVGRFFLLGISLEYDEMFTAATANPAVALPDIWKNFLIIDVHPPLHNVLLWVYNHFVPYNGSEGLLRWPSTVLGLLGLWLAWKLFPRYLGKTARWLFMLLLSSNFYLLLYAQHARAYSLVLFLALPLTFLYLQMARCIAKKRPICRTWWIAYGVLSLLLCWSHYFGALLFGLFSVCLFIYAWRNRQPLKWFIIVPALVLIGFLPWLIPNLLYNIGQNRFSGNWWGNKTKISWHLLRLWIEFFFCLRKNFYLLLGIIGVNIFYVLWQRRKYPRWPYGRELAWVFFPLAAALILVFSISFKINWLLWRYFIAFMPCLYIGVALLVAPVCKRYKICWLLFLVFIGMNFRFYFKMVPQLQRGRIFSGREAMEVYNGAFADKDLYVIAVEAFPPSTMSAMYGFYPHYRFHIPKEVHEIFRAAPATREALLARADQALLWLPHCSNKNMDLVTQTFQRSMAIFGKVYDNCFIVVADETDRTQVNPALLHTYKQRFDRYMQTRSPQ